MKIYKKDIPYLISFLVLLFYIVSKINIITYAKSKIYIAEQKYLSKQMISYSNNNNYKCLSTSLYEIYFTENDEEFIPIIYNILNTYYPHLVSDFNIDIKKINKIKIIIYPTKEVFASVMNLESKNNLPMGIYYAGVINLLSFNEYILNDINKYDVNYISKNGPLIHELTHFLLDKKTSGNFDVWFAEGTALYYENKYTNFIWAENLNTNMESISIKDLQNDFREIDEILAYKKSFDIINNFVDKYGEDKLQIYINDLK